MEELIEELTKVNPSNLSEEGLKLFNKINEIIDRNRELEEKYNYEKNRARTELDTVYINARYDERDKWKSKVKKIRDKAEVMDYYTLPDVIDDLNKLLEEE